MNKIAASTKVAYIIALSACVMGRPIANGADSTNAPAVVPTKKDFASFRGIYESNIFNTRRSARYVPSDQPSVRRRSDSFALVGTMHYDKGPFAFFDGTRSDYRKVLKPDDTIAGFKVAQIESSFVKLASPTNQIELRVGMQMRREGEGDWQLSVRPESMEPSAVQSSTHLTFQSQPTASADSSNGDFSGGLSDVILPGFGSDSTANPGSPGSQPSVSSTNVIAVPGTPGGNESDVLLRLMQRRAQERGE